MAFLTFPGGTLLVALSAAPVVLPGCPCGRPRRSQDLSRRPRTPVKAPLGVLKGFSKAILQAVRIFSKNVEKTKGKQWFFNDFLTDVGLKLDHVGSCWFMLALS